MTGKIILLSLLCFPTLLSAHFQELIPSADIITHRNDSTLSLDLTFTHPMNQGPVMPMEMPVAFGVMGPGGREDLLASLEPREKEGQSTFLARYKIRQPGDHIFYLQPAPYWETSESKMITHYTKVIVDAYDGSQQWQKTVGFPVEISPLVRPYGLWSGNLFRGEVRKEGRPVPYAMVEVEWRNDGSLTPPPPPFTTQMIKADASGTFSYAMPRAGWWGFAALMDSDQNMNNPQGRSVPAELGAVIWVKTRGMQ